ncbi:MAG: hypothetical protein HOP10_14480 [Chitinophagaceae bacterium]|nr:hypothetical protein [Chitinophagaceae bacterium]
MKKIKGLLLVLLMAGSLAAQKVSPIDSIRFFTDERLVEVTLNTDIKGLQNSKGDEVYQPATITCRFPDSTVINETIRIAARGHFRRENCVIPPLLLNFRNETSPQLSSLHKLKLVIGCANSSTDEQLVLKEYLAYKTYNQLDEKSFRVRLVRVTYQDSRSRIKTFSQYAFFIEDDDNMAERLGYEAKKQMQIPAESTNRQTMTMVALFEYMISNGDWSVPALHNIKLIYKKNEQTVPHAVPYDFDHSGFVNAGYALPSEILGTETVRERVYRGFARTMEELQAALDVFRAKRNSINDMINNFFYMSSRNKKELVEYLDEFYTTINNKNQVKSIFIDNARTQ